MSQSYQKVDHRSYHHLHLNYMAEPLHDASSGGNEFEDDQNYFERVLTGGVVSMPLTVKIIRLKEEKQAYINDLSSV